MSGYLVDTAAFRLGPLSGPLNTGAEFRYSYLVGALFDCDQRACFSPL